MANPATSEAIASRQVRSSAPVGSRPRSSSAARPSHSAWNCRVASSIERDPRTPISSIRATRPRRCRQACPAVGRNPATTCGRPRCLKRPTVPVARCSVALPSEHRSSVSGRREQIPTSAASRRRIPTDGWAGLAAPAGTSRADRGDRSSRIALDRRSDPAVPRAVRGPGRARSDAVCCLPEPKNEPGATRSPHSSPGSPYDDGLIGPTGTWASPIVLRTPYGSVRRRAPGAQSRDFPPER